ncbi:MAG: hypothetical protein JSW53_06435 [Candidatus Bathyarchaeota archaeon]|nr:MAG: hypothetical protein JSW53_06435 [Candidatus Bathyarchaeota archaeon]
MDSEPAVGEFFHVLTAAGVVVSCDRKIIMEGLEGREEAEGILEELLLSYDDGGFPK